MRLFVLLCVVVFLVYKNVCAEPIDKLPGVQFDVNFKHYSGFLNASKTHFLHYWFVESQRSPTDDPLVFWFNGGPGCSSLDGLLNEMGPYVINPDGKSLRPNPNAWNKISNVVYIESPAGVGYSYSTDGNTTTDDDQTSLENYESIKNFFTIHPEFRNHAVFIFAESYGGVYGPTLAARIVDGQKDFPLKLKGLALGNGYVDAKLNIDTSVRYAYGHGIIDEKVWNTLELECCRGCIDGCDLTTVTGHCAVMVEDIFNFLWAGGLNPYDLYRNCDPNPSTNSIRMESLKRGLVPDFIQEKFFAKFNNSLKSELTKRRRADRYIPRYGSSVPCMNDTDVLSYMNSPEVRKALHIPDNLGTWDICSDKVTTTYKKTYDNMAPFIKKVIENQVRVLLYYGDTDMACNFMMGQQFSNKLGLKRQLNKTPWKFDKQIAGFKTQYKGLTFITIRGAGHMAPQWRAPQMFYVFEQFLINHPI